MRYLQLNIFNFFIIILNPVLRIMREMFIHKEYYIALPLGGGGELLYYGHIRNSLQGLWLSKYMHLDANGPNIASQSGVNRTGLKPELKATQCRFG
jgi:hypothetical protein